MRRLPADQLLATLDILPRMPRFARDEPAVASLHGGPGLGGSSFMAESCVHGHPVPFWSWVEIADASVSNSLVGAVPCSTTLLDPITVLRE